MRAEAKGQDLCGADADFLVVGPPDTDTSIDPGSTPGTLVFILFGSGMAGFLLAMRRIASRSS